jgi:hypothetical protein
VVPADRFVDLSTTGMKAAAERIYADVRHLLHLGVQ